jgi:tRNA threonylcarbamoyl adenosine modification protein YeaZ
MILAIDTAGPWVAVAVGSKGETQSAQIIPARLNHNEELPGLVDRVMSEAGAAKADAVAVDIGPGSFTGTRVGVSFAIGLAQGWRVKILPISSFRMAVEMASDSAEAAAIAMPVVPRQWCLARMRKTGGRWHEESVVEIPALDSYHVSNGTPLVVPWGGHVRGIAPAPDWNPASVLLAMAASADAGDWYEPEKVRVRYVGPSQAERRFHERRQHGDA